MSDNALQSHQPAPTSAHAPSSSSSSSSSGAGSSAVMRSVAGRGEGFAAQAALVEPVQRKERSGGASPIQKKEKPGAVQMDAAVSTQPNVTAAEVPNPNGAQTRTNAAGTQTALVSGSMAANPKFEEHARMFEDKLGRDAATKGTTAADAIAAMCKRYIQQKCAGWSADNERLKTEIVRIGGDPIWMGSVGREVENLMAVFDSGNLRMKMFHIGNFYSQMLQPDLLSSTAKELEDWTKGTTIRAGELAQRLQDQRARNQTPNLTQMPEGSEVAGQNAARVRESTMGQTNGNAGETAASMEQRSGVPMHPAEFAGQRENPANQTTGAVANPQQDILQFNSGAQAWAVNEQNRWVMMCRQLSLPLEAGPSGTTNWLMSAARDLGYGNMEQARLSCIGHLLPNHHHSLVEIMAAAAPYCGGFTPGQQMYRNIGPYQPGELRAFGLNNKFPDESQDEATPNGNQLPNGTGGLGTPAPAAG